MKRLLSLMLMVLFGLPMVAPALGLTGGTDVSLPACCRRGGKHHCMRTMGAERSVSLRAPKCAMFPGVGTQAKHGDGGFVCAGLCFAEAVSQPAIEARVLARVRVARDRARGKRGPPPLA